LADHALYSEHPEARVAVTVHSFFLMPLLLSSSRMVALTNERLARQIASLADIKILELLFDTPTTEEAIYLHPRVSSDPGHRWFRDILKKSTVPLAEGT
jgi:LysR family nod box-dependent transcriptional activator